MLRTYGVGAGRRLPRLLSGAEREMRVRELLAGNASGEGRTRWPAELAPALRLRGFATEVARPARPRPRARPRRRHACAGSAPSTAGRPGWPPATFMDEYLDVLAIREEVDYAGLIARAVDLLDGPARELSRPFQRGVRR